MKLLSYLSLSALLGATSASAALIINIKEVGGDVVVTSDGGTLNTAGMGVLPNNAPSNDQSMLPAVGRIINTFTVFNRDLYSGIVFPTGMGGFVNSSASFATGDNFGLNNGFLILPTGYAGTGINFSQTYTGQSFATMALNTGSYTYTMPVDTVTVNVVVPEPSTYIALAGFAGLGLFLWRRRLKAKAPAAQ